MSIREKKNHLHNHDSYSRLLEELKIYNGFKILQRD